MTKRRIRVTIMFPGLACAALVAATFPAATAYAVDYLYEAVTKAGDARVQGPVDANGLPWDCDGNRCTISGPWPSPGVSACRNLANRVGQLRSYGRSGAMLTQPQLDSCNSVTGDTGILETVASSSLKNNRIQLDIGSPERDASASRQETLDRAASTVSPSNPAARVWIVPNLFFHKPTSSTYSATVYFINPGNREARFSCRRVARSLGDRGFGPRQTDDGRVSPGEMGACTFEHRGFGVDSRNMWFAVISSEPMIPAARAHGPGVLEPVIAHAVDCSTPQGHEFICDAVD